MKVCIPTVGYGGLEEHVGEHFGRVPTYTIFDTETNEVKVIENTSEHMGGSGYPPEILAREGVGIMLCSGLGRRAIGLFEQFGIMVYIGAMGTVRNALDRWKEGGLQPATDETACKKHAFHGHKDKNESRHRKW